MINSDIVEQKIREIRQLEQQKVALERENMGILPYQKKYEDGVQKI